jgi:hypothetical protein
VRVWAGALVLGAALPAAAQRTTLNGTLNDDRQNNSGPS